MNETYNTLAIHGGLEPDPLTGAILTPIYQSTTFVQPGIGEHKGYTYSRVGNPTVDALERALGSLEAALPAVAYSTGMGAVMGVFLSFLKSGDHVVCGDVVYGGTVRALQQVLSLYGIEATFVDMTDLDATRAAFRPNTRLCVIESPANPTLKLADIAAVSNIAHEFGALSVVDNTFLTAVLQQPLDLGADLSVYSTTKYIEGHNATIGGAIVTRNSELRDRLCFLRKCVGSIQAPFEAWLTLRGLKTLPIRMREHSRRALDIATWLSSQPGIERVVYPGLEDFPQRELALRQQKDGGGLIAFELEGGLEAGRKFLAGLRLCSLAENLGAVETLVTHSASMTHADVPREQRLAAGIADGLIRLSVGLEDVEDLIEDIQQALQSARLCHV